MVCFAAGLLLGGFFIGFYDLLHQPVAHHILFGQTHLRDALDILQDMQCI